MAAIFSTQVSQANMGRSIYLNMWQKFDPDSFSLKKSSSYLVISLSKYILSLNERLLKEIKPYLQILLKKSD